MQPEDWYKVSRADVLKAGSRSLFNVYPSLERVLRATYPDYPWDSAKFVAATKIPSGHWKDKDNITKALDDIEKQMQIKEVILSLSFFSSLSLSLSLTNDYN